MKQFDDVAQLHRHGGPQYARANGPDSVRGLDSGQFCSSSKMRSQKTLYASAYIQ